MPKFKIDRAKIPELITDNTEYARFMKKFNQCARLLERNPDISPTEYNAISRLMTNMQNEMHSYNPRNPLPEGGMESLNLIRSLVNEVRDPNQIAEAVSDVTPFISSRETTTSLPHNETQQKNKVICKKDL